MYHPHAKDPPHYDPKRGIDFALQVPDRKQVWHNSRLFNRVQSQFTAAGVDFLCVLSKLLDYARKLRLKV